MKFLTKKSGAFTIIELLLTIAIAGIITAVLLFMTVGRTKSTQVKEETKLPLSVSRINSKEINGVLRKLIFENHTYLLYEYGSGAGFMLHSESCPCKENK